ILRSTSPDAFERLDVLPRLEVARVVGDAVSLSASAAWREDVWLRERTAEVSQRGYPVLDAMVETELARTFSTDVRHTIAPSVQVRAVPIIVGSPAPVQYDEVDVAVPGPAAQAVAQVRQRLQVRGRGDVLRLDLGQGFSLWPTLTTGETFARAL